MVAWYRSRWSASISNGSRPSRTLQAAAPGVAIVHQHELPDDRRRCVRLADPDDAVLVVDQHDDGLGGAVEVAGRVSARRTIASTSARVPWTREPTARPRRCARVPACRSRPSPQSSPEPPRSRARGRATARPEGAQVVGVDVDEAGLRRRPTTRAGAGRRRRRRVEDARARGRRSRGARARSRPGSTTPASTSRAPRTR